MSRPAKALLRAVPLAVIACLLAGPTLSADAPAKGERRTIQPVPKAPPRTARIGGGGTVELAPSSLTRAELATLRPNYENLKPRLNNP